MTAFGLKMHPETAKITQLAWNVIDRNLIDPLLFSGMQK